MITFKINLMQYKAAIQKVKNNAGREIDCLVIPIELNSLVKGEKGVYADFVAFEMKEKKEGRNDTHLVKQSFPKEIFQKMTEEAKKDQPIFGNLRVWDGTGEHNATSSMDPITENDKLPWE